MDSGAIFALSTSAATGTALRLSSELCEALRAAAFEGLKALPKRGLEVGGLLTRPAGAGSTFTVDGFELIPCQHLYGPSYRLSPPERENFRKRCREIEAGDAVNVACFFRSSTRDALQLT